MRGEERLTDLEHWLETEPKWKVLVIGVPFTRNWRSCSDEVDSRGGYLFERQRLLEIMWRTEEVVIMSGDTHKHATTLFPSPDRKENVFEFSTSPLSKFYQPFKRSYLQLKDTDVELFSCAKGVSKFSVLTFNTTDPSGVNLNLELIMDRFKV